MRTFDKRLWDNSDPDYAPCITYSGKYPRWKAPARYVKAGYRYKGERLEGVKGDNLHQARAARCVALTRDMVRWMDGELSSGPKHGTWAYVISRYRGDDLSPMNDGSIKANTREGYVQQLDRLEQVWGDVDLDGTNFAMVKAVIKAMQDKGRSVDFIKRHVDTLRRVCRFGKAYEIPGCMRILSILEEVKVQTPAARNVIPTRDQVYAIIEEADRRNMHGFALGIMIQFEFSLRPVDVRGQWLKTDDGKRWQDGLTWDMFDRELSGFSKVISKTKRSMPEPYWFDLTALPDIQKRLAAMPTRVGPVIVSRDNVPYEKTAWSRTWARLRDNLGLPKEIQCMDLRAGGITEAQQAGATQTQLRNAAQHKSIKTTDRYMRARSDDANKVVTLRRTNAAR